MNGATAERPLSRDRTRPLRCRRGQHSSCGHSPGSVADTSIRGFSRPSVEGHKAGFASVSSCAAPSKPALWLLIIVWIVLPRIVVLAAAPGRIIETPATPAEAEVVTARDA